MKQDASVLNQCLPKHVHVCACSWILHHNGVAHLYGADRMQVASGIIGLGGDGLAISMRLIGSTTLMDVDISTATYSDHLLAFVW